MIDMYTEEGKRLRWKRIPQNRFVSSLKLSLLLSQDAKRGRSDNLFSWDRISLPGNSYSVIQNMVGVLTWKILSTFPRGTILKFFCETRLIVRVWKLFCDGNGKFYTKLINVGIYKVILDILYLGVLYVSKLIGVYKRK